MKTTLFLATLAICLLLLIWQRSAHQAQFATDAQALSALQAKYDAAVLENRGLKQTMQKQAAIRGALVSGLPLVTRYRAGEKK